MAGLLACPQLLSDDFGRALDPGDDTCARRRTCAAGAGGSRDVGGAAGAAGAPSGSGGSASSAGGPSAGNGGSASGGSAGGASEGGDAGTSGDAGSSGAGGSDPADASAGPAELDCWLIGLEDTTHVASDNCLGINGWNDVTNDADSDVDNTSYADDRVCFTGTVASGDWGAVFNLTLDDTDPWNAVALGVSGFQLEAEGASLPPEIQVIYTDDSAGDFCRQITPAAAVEVPFSSAHPDCSTSSSTVTDATDLTFIRLVLPATASDYAVDFCLGIRAIP